MEPGGQDVREEREVEDALHRLVPVGELQQLEVGVRDHHVLGLPALPAAEVEAVSPARGLGVDVETDVGVPLPAVAAATTCDVEGDRDQVARLDELHVAAGLDDLAGVLMAQHHALGGDEASSVDVQVAAADVGRDQLDDDPVIALLAARVDQFRVVEFLDLDGAGPRVDDCSIAGHGSLLFFQVFSVAYVG